MVNFGEWSRANWNASFNQSECDAPTFTSAALITQISGFFYSIVLQSIHYNPVIWSALTPVIQIFSISDWMPFLFFFFLLLFISKYLSRSPAPRALFILVFVCVCVRGVQNWTKAHKWQEFFRQLYYCEALAQQKENFTIQKNIKYFNTFHKSVTANVLWICFFFFVVFFFVRYASLFLVPLQVLELYALAPWLFFSLFFSPFPYIVWAFGISFHLPYSTRCNLVASLKHSHRFMTKKEPTPM